MLSDLEKSSYILYSALNVVYYYFMIYNANNRKYIYLSVYNIHDKLNLKKVCFDIIKYSFVSSRGVAANQLHPTSFEPQTIPGNCILILTNQRPFKGKQKLTGKAGPKIMLYLIQQKSSMKSYWHQNNNNNNNNSLIKPINSTKSILKCVTCTIQT